MGTIKSTLIALGYIPATQRPRCGNCQRAESSLAAETKRPQVFCIYGQFKTSPGAICQHHQTREASHG